MGGFCVISKKLSNHLLQYCIGRKNVRSTRAPSCKNYGGSPTVNTCTSFTKNSVTIIIGLDFESNHSQRSKILFISYKRRASVKKNNCDDNGSMRRFKSSLSILLVSFYIVFLLFHFMWSVTSKFTIRQKLKIKQAHLLTQQK